jgi:cell division protein FtsQ
MSKKNIIIYSVFALVFVACFVFYSILSKDRKYTNILYDIEYPSDTLFTEQEFNQYVEKIYPKIIGKPIDSVNLSIVEKKIETYPYISNADVINNRGTLLIKAQQEKIIAKIFNNIGEQFYLAESGKLVPKSKNTAGRLLIVNGNINKRYSEKCLACESDTAKNREKNKEKMNYSTLCIVWKIACFIENDPFWRAQISQIYVNDRQEIELIPTIGEHEIAFGRIASSDDIDKVIKQKFSNLGYIYTDGFRITGWDKYKSINLKYGTEVVCERR